MELSLCNKPIRECNFGVFASSDFTEENIKTEVTLDHLKEALIENEDYIPCHNCMEYKRQQWGVPWLEKIHVKGPLEAGQAVHLFQKYFIDKKRKLKLASYPNGALTIPIIRARLRHWERKEGFVPDIILIDYADLLVPTIKQDFRHQQNDIWKNLRRLSQEVRGGIEPTVVTATQADALSYDQELLTLKNYSEDKRKFAHTTGFYGLNQDPQGREKKIGIMRINELSLREGDSSIDNVVTILQNIKRGLPYVTSYF